MEGGLRKPAAEKRSGGVFLPYPLTVAIGDSEEMQKAIAMLDEVKESIINAYELKTGMSRAKLAHLMDAETWMNANKAIELGFADGVLADEKKQAAHDDVMFSFSRRAVTNSLLNKLQRKQASKADTEETPLVQTTELRYPAEPLYQRLSLISH